MKTTMTIETSIESIVIDERNHVTSSAYDTTTKKRTPYVNPDVDSPSDSSFASSMSTSCVSSLSRSRRSRSDSFDDGVGPRIVISEHKHAELEGRHAEEPLLRENPGRFVLFPIKEPEVHMADMLPKNMPR